MSPRAKMSTTCLPPDFGDGTPMERFERILKRVIAAPKADVDRAMAAEPRHKKKRKNVPA